MVELFTRVWLNLIHRLHGPLTFRLILQPLTAAVLAVRAGLRGRKGFREAWHDVARVFVFAVAVDLVYEVIEFHKFYPGESLIVAAILALVPYSLIRTILDPLLRSGIPGNRAATVRER
jgi:hypothetical protein